MNCRQAVRMLSSYLDGELNGVALSSLQKHLSVCPKCLSEFQEFREMDQLIRNGPRFEPQAEFRPYALTTSRRRPSEYSGLARAAYMAIEEILAFFNKQGAPRTDTLEAFQDAPPCSLSRIYLTMLGDKCINGVG